VLEQLALIEPVTGSDVHPVRDDLVIAVVTADPAIGLNLGPRGAGELGLALVLDTAEWGATATAPGDDVRRRMESAGWHATTVPWPGDLLRAWTDVTRAADTAEVGR
jgi:hypothetical protein